MKYANLLRGPIVRGVVIAGAAAGLAACSSMPAWTSPTNLADRLLGREDAPPPPRAEYPEVANVPRTAPAVTPPTQRTAQATALAADRTNAQYTAEQLRQGGTAGDIAVAPVTPLPGTAAAAAPAPQLAQATQPAAPRPATPVAPGLVVPDLAVPVPPVFQGGPQVTVGTQAQTVPPPVVAVAPLQPTSATPAQPVPAPAVAAPAPAPAAAPAPALAPAPAAIAAAPAPATVAPAPQLAQTAATPAAARPAATPAPTAAPALTQAQVQAVLPTQNAGGQDTLARTFAQMLAQSQGTVTVLSPLGGPAPVIVPQPQQAIPGPAAPGTPFPNVTVGGIAGRPQASVTTPGTSTRQLNLGAASRQTATIQFAHDSNRLSADAMRSIRAVADQYKARGGKVHVVGHASMRTKDMPVDKHVMVNFRVSVERAQAVANELLRLGVPPAALVVDAVGDTQPRFLEAMPAGEAGNRRVELYVEA